jgi:hypothetical protein
MDQTRRQNLTPVPRRGRPRAAERLVTVSFRCAESEYDRLIRVASQRRQDVSPLVRSLLMLRLPKDESSF